CGERLCRTFLSELQYELDDRSGDVCGSGSTPHNDTGFTQRPDQHAILCANQRHRWNGSLFLVRYSGFPALRPDVELLYGCTVRNVNAVRAVHIHGGGNRCRFAYFLPVHESADSEPTERRNG